MDERKVTHSSALYVVLYETDLSQLARNVRAHIKEQGWRPQGGISSVVFPPSQYDAAASPIRQMFYQAMVNPAGIAWDEEQTKQKKLEEQERKEQERKESAEKQHRERVEKLEREQREQRQFEDLETPSMFLVEAKPSKASKGFLGRLFNRS